MRSRGSEHVISIVEAAYRAARAEPNEWLSRVLTAAQPALDLGQGVLAYEYDTNRPYHAWLDRPVVVGADPALADVVLAAFPDTPRALNEAIHQRGGVVTILSELVGKLATEVPSLGPHARRARVGDMLGVNASDPSGRGVYLCAPAARLVTRDASRVEMWGRVAAHIAAAARLRSVFRNRDAEAVLSPDGKLLHAHGRALTVAEPLRRAARELDRARSRSDGLEAWRALVEGRWSLVDEVERDGKRLLLAYANAPHVVDPRRLSAIERVIAGYVAMGHPNKLIAYELGISEGTVKSQLHRIMKKFGVRTRTEVADRFARLRSAQAHVSRVGDEDVIVIRSGSPSSKTLTDSENHVASLAARGHSNRAIAAARGTTVRTVANQLARIFEKLGVGSRAELAAALDR